MKTILKSVLFRRGYWLIAAAWLFTLSFIFSNYWSYTASEKAIAQKVQQHLDQRVRLFHSLIQDSVWLDQLMHQQLTEEQVADFTKLPFTFLIYPSVTSLQSPEIWNNQSVVLPEQWSFLKPAQLLQSANGQYITVFRLLKESRVAVAIIPLRHKYFIENNYLRPSFVGLKRAENYVQLQVSPTPYPIFSTEGVPLVYIKKKSAIVEEPDPISTVLRLFAFVLLILFVQSLVRAIHLAGQTKVALSVVIAFSITAYLLCFYFPFPIDWRLLAAFDPSIYAANNWLRSLGDVLLGQCFLFGITVNWVLLIPQPEINKGKNRYAQLGWSVLWILSLFAVTITQIALLNSLIRDGHISLDVANLEAYSGITLLALLCMALIAFNYFLVSRQLWFLLYQQWNDTSVIPLILLFALGLSLLSIWLGTFHLMVLGWLVFYGWLQRQSFFHHSLRTIRLGAVMLWLFFFAISISSLILYQQQQKSINEQKSYAQKLAIQIDPANESILSMTFAYLDNRFFADNFQRLSNKAENKQLKDSIIGDFFGGYLNKFETRFYTFDARGKGLHNADSIGLGTFQAILAVQAKPTKVPNLFYYETGFDKFNYLYRQVITDSLNQLLGTVVVQSIPKRFKSEALYPELFRQYVTYGSGNPTHYPFAVYGKGTLLLHSNDYPFPTTLTANQAPVLTWENRTVKNYHMLWHAAGGGKVVVIAAKKPSVWLWLSLFAYLFAAFLLLIVLLRLFSWIIVKRFPFVNNTAWWQLPIRRQIHFTIVGISAFSFVLIGITMLYIINKRYQRNNEEKLSKLMQTMSMELQQKLVAHQMTDDGLPLYDPLLSSEWQSVIKDVGEIHNADINIYDLGGNLQVSSQPLVYAQGILSNKMDAFAYYHLHQENAVQFQHSEQLGELQFNSIYAPLRDADGKAHAYINIPYFASENELRQEIANFLVTIINLNAIIFILGSIISLLLTNRITRSFQLIANKMKAISLGKANEAIVWDRQDEIGELIKEYNKMVGQLETSAKALASSEREGAWREMARQVAHEIKNPLTPMKLSVQHLQQILTHSNDEKVQQFAKRMAVTLVEQIDHLAKIASDFSQFANIANAQLERLDMKEIIQPLVALYGSYDRLAIQLQAPEEPIWVMADRTQMNRLFTNLIKNATEAVEDKPLGKVQIEIDKLGQEWIFTIADNGNGIPQELRHKIFMPNFTTKSSGTGLGLAICKCIVEKAGGHIRYETGSLGTCFIVHLPISS